MSLDFTIRGSLAKSEGLGVFAGCLCCSTEADVVGAVTKLLGVGGEIDHLVIECSGMAQVLVLHIKEGTIIGRNLIALLESLCFVLCSRSKSAM